MKCTLHWNQQMNFTATSEQNSVAMDSNAPFGKGEAMTPKQLVAAGLAGCTAMDVIALLKKHKQDVQSFDIDVDIATSTGGHPAVFTKAVLTFLVTGNVEAQILNESVELSQTKYCGVSAMLSKALPIEYIVMLNGNKVGQGQAHF